MITQSDMDKIRGVTAEIVSPRAGASFGDFLRAVRYGDPREVEKVGSERVVAKAAMSGNSGATGGYLVPAEMSLSMMKTIAEESFLLPKATKIPMTSRTAKVPVIDFQTTPAAAAISPFFGGLVLRWGSEQSPAATEPTFRQLELVAWDLLGYCTVSNDFLYDLTDAGEKHLKDLFAKAAAWYAEYAFLRGTGSADSMPLGIVNAPGTLLVTRAGANSVAAIDIAAMSAALLPRSWKTAVWVCNPTALLKIVQLSTYWMNSPGKDHTEGIAGYLVTRPVYVTEKLPALGTKGDLLLIDPSLYVVGNRQEVVIDASTEGSAFRTNSTDFRIWLRMDGKPANSATITLADDVTIASPFVCLN